MAKVTTKRKRELLQGVFQVLAEYPEGLPARDVLPRVQSLVPPNDFEKTEYESEPGTRRYEKIPESNRALVPIRPVWYLAPN